MNALRFARAVCFVAASACGLLLGCGPRAGSGHHIAAPEETARAYIAAIRRGDARGAYAHFGPTVRARYSVRAFIRMVRDDREELLLYADELETQLDAGLTVRADIPVRTGGILRLVLESGRWRVDESVLSEVPPGGAATAVIPRGDRR